MEWLRSLLGPDRNFGGPVSDDPTVTRRARLLDLSLFLLAAVAVALYLSALRGFVFEEAYGTLRAADNLAGGRGLVLDPGERGPVPESPLLALLLAVFGVFGLDVAAVGLVVSVLGLGATALLGCRIARRLGFPHTGTVFALLVLWGAGRLTTVSRTETTLMTALALAALAAALAGRTVPAGALAGLVCLTRPDGIAFALPLLALLLVRSGAERSRAWRAVLVALGIVVPWTVFSWLFYGTLSPASTSSGDGMSATLLSSAGSLIWALLPEPLASLRIPKVFPSLALLLLAGHVLSRTGRLVHRQTLSGVLAIFPLLQWLIFAVAGRPMHQVWHLLPGLVFFLLLCLLTWGHALATDDVRIERGFAIAGGVVVALSFLLLPWRTRWESAWTSQDHYRRTTGADGRLARYINEHGLGDLRLSAERASYLTFLTGNPRVEASDRADLVVASEDSAAVGRKSDFVALCHGTDRSLFIRKEALEARLPDLVERWLDDDSDERIELGHPLEFGFETGERKDRRSFEGWWGRDRFEGSPVRMTFRKKRVREPYLSTHEALTGKRQSTLSSPPFRLDFDELTFRFAADGGSRTALELLVNGLPVLRMDGEGTESGVFYALHWPVGAWAGKVAVLRVVDTSASGSVALGHLRSVVFKKKVLFEDFESGYGGKWSRTFGERPATGLEIARRLGPRFLVGRRTAVSWSDEGFSGEPRVLASRPLTIDHKYLSMLIYDFGGEETEVRLRIGATVVLRFAGRGSGEIVPIDWPVGRYWGKRAVLEAVDGDPRPDRWIGLDQVVFHDD